MNESNAILDDILSRWHHWCKSFSAVPTCSADPMFRQAKSARGWDTLDDIAETEINSKTMEAVDFQVGEMDEPFRSAIYAVARNLYTGRSVWISPRLPKEKNERVRVVAEARFMLINRLEKSGII